MSGFELPRNLVRRVENRDEDVVPRRIWLASLPDVVDDLARRWSLTLSAPFQPGGSASWVAPARGPGGEHLVLKVGWWHEEAAHEGEGLRAWDGGGSVRLYDAVAEGQTSALLLEACEPGTTLSQAPPPRAG